MVDAIAIKPMVGNRIKTRVQINDVYTISENQFDTRGLGYFLPCSGFKVVNLPEGNHEIDIDFCTSTSGQTVRIRKARLLLWRIE